MAVTVERVAFPPAVADGLLLHAAAYPVDGVLDEADGVKRVEDDGRVGEGCAEGAFISRNGSSAATRTRAAPVRAAFGAPVGDDPLAAAGEDVEEAGRATAGRFEVDQAGDELRGPGRGRREKRGLSSRPRTETFVVAVLSTPTRRTAT